MLVARGQVEGGVAVGGGVGHAVTARVLLNPLVPEGDAVHTGPAVKHVHVSVLSLSVSLCVAGGDGEWWLKTGSECRVQILSLSPPPPRAAGILAVRTQGPRTGHCLTLMRTQGQRPSSRRQILCSKLVNKSDSSSNIQFDYIRRESKQPDGYMNKT